MHITTQEFQGLFCHFDYTIGLLEKYYMLIPCDNNGVMNKQNETYNVWVKFGK